ncbi:hypothetical protein Tco_1239384 [Tanacetum coccineum]
MLQIVLHYQIPDHDMEPHSSNEFHVYQLPYKRRASRQRNQNPSSLKRVYFFNSIVLLNKEDEAKEEGNVKSSTTEYKDHEMTVESEEELEEETEEKIKEKEEDSLKHFDTFPTMK